MAFTKATKTQRKAHIALIGPTGAGKTLTALKMARHLLEPGKRIAVIDTENASASLYSDDFDFDTEILASFSPRDYIKAIHDAEAAGFGVLIIDSLSHAWAGKNGVLEMVDNAAKRSNTGSTFNGWRDATPEHNDLVDALVRCKIDLIVTMRSKMAYVQERDEKTGKTVVRKIGLQPVQREGLEYEFDLIADMDVDHHLIVGKTRCSAMDAVVALKPEGDIIEPFRAWIRSGAPESEAPAPQPPAESVPPVGRSASAPASAGRDEPPATAQDALARTNGTASTAKITENQAKMLGILAGKAHASIDQMQAILGRLYGKHSRADLTKAEASDLITRLKAIEDGNATLDDLLADSDDPLKQAQDEARRLARECGMTDEEVAPLLEQMVDQQSSEAMIAQLRKERAGLPF